MLRTDLLQQRSLSGAARELLGDAGGWQSSKMASARIADSGELLAAFRAERESLLTLGPKLLAATGNVVSALSPAELEANQIQIERLELTVEEMQQSARALGAPGAAAASARRLGDPQQFLGEVIGGLSGNDTSLGITSVAGRAPADALESATSLFEQVRAAIAQIGATSQRRRGTRSGARRVSTTLPIR